MIIDELVGFSNLYGSNEELVLAAAKETGKVVTVEEHSVIGGLGSAVAELLAEKCPTPLRRVGVEDVFGMSGPATELLDLFGLNAANICAKAKEAIAMK